jgi:basic membrane protein A and related proteins
VTRTRSARLTVGLGLAVALLASSIPAMAQDASPAAAEVPSVPESAAGTTVALVSPQRAGDDGPVDDMVAALEQAETDFGIVTTLIEATDPSTYVQTLQNLAQTGTRIVVAAFPGFQAPLAEVAPQFPETRFVHIFADPDETTIDNLRRVSYVIHPGFYLGGILAASIAQARGSNQIGYIGGIALPSLAANYHAYVAGAQSVLPDVQVSGAWADSFEDPAKGLELASAMYADGVTVIQTDSAATSNGVLDAAIAADAYMIKDSDPSQISLAPDRIPAVSFLAFGDSVYQEITAALQDEWAGGHVQSGLAEGITGLATSGEFATAVADAAVGTAFTEALPAIEAAQAAILDGSLEVPFNTDTNF